MKLLVTGGAGYIGSHVVRQLSEAGHEVSVVDNLSTGRGANLVHNETLYHTDLSDASAMDKIFETGKFEAVLHFAASIVVPESVSNPLKYYLNNTVNSTYLIQRCLRFGVKKFIFSSTAAVYGVPEGGVAFETSKTQPTSPYGESKAMTEKILKDVSVAEKDFKFVALRYFNVAGADPQARMGQTGERATHLIRLASQAAVGVQSGIDIFGTDYPTPDGTCIRDYIHVEDLANAHLLALDYLNAGHASDVFNVGYGEGFSVREVIATIEKVIGRPLEKRAAARRLGDPEILVSNADKIRLKLNWKPQYQSLETIITHALNWEIKLSQI